VAELMVRCHRCYEVFDAEEGPCPNCGTPYRPPTPQPRPIDGLYTERYAQPEEVPAVAFRAGPKPPRKVTSVQLVGIGGIFVGLAVVAAMVVAPGGGGVAATAGPHYVMPAETPGTAVPTLGPIVALTFDQIGGFRFDAHVSVAATIQLNAKVNGKAQSITTRFDGQVAEANQSGIVQTGGASLETRLVDGYFYVRTMPSGKWSVLPSLPAYLLISPAFGIRSTADLVMQGPATREGRLVNHLQSSPSWEPDISRLAMTDLSRMPVQPDTFLLDLWVTDDGAPVWAAVSATKIDDSGAKLIDVEVAYTFTNVGVPTALVAPISPSPSPSPTPGY
jgi:hypothetical protein